MRRFGLSPAQTTRNCKIISMNCILVHDTHSMKDCVKACYAMAKPGDTVLLSPCCAISTCLRTWKTGNNSNLSSMLYKCTTTLHINLYILQLRKDVRKWTQSPKTISSKETCYLMSFFILCMVSIVEVYSASSTLSYKGGNYWAPLLKTCWMLRFRFFYNDSCDEHKVSLFQDSHITCVRLFRSFFWSVVCLLVALPMVKSLDRDYGHTVSTVRNWVKAPWS